MTIRKTVLVISILSLICLSCASAFAMTKEERQFLLMYFNEEEIQVVSTTRSLKSISRVAENVEVVTKEDIELMNAHTLVDVLNTIIGVQIAFSGTSPGGVGIAQVQGSRIDHVVVLVDGVTINDISGGVPFIEQVPAQIIEKVEVIKGPASSSWGSSLGGVVNVITKTASLKDDFGGTLSESRGKDDSGDFRAELRGGKGAAGYYLFAGKLQTDGLRPRDNSRHNQLYSKMCYDVSSATAATLTLLYSKDNEGGGDFDAYDFKFDSKYETILSSLSVKSRLNDAASFEVSARTLSMNANGMITDIPSGDVTGNPLVDRRYGGSAKMDIGDGIHSFVAGADYDALKTKFSGMAVNERIAAVYLNDTVSLGGLTVTPGLRLDSVDVQSTSLQETFLSPSLGLTYVIGEKTLLRAVVARGFNIPAISFLTSDSLFFRKNPDLKLETVWSSHVGIETGALKYLWLKITAFRHEIHDAIQREDISFEEQTWTYVNKNRARRQGVEAEIRTIAFRNFVLATGAAYIDSKDLDAGEEIKNNPQYAFNASLKYDDKRTLRGIIKGYLVNWNSTPDFNAKYDAFIVDANVIKTVYRRDPVCVELFLSGHNVFNGSSYWLENYRNARRWFEGGVMVKF